ncbi:hypothetical protein PPO43_10020 [Saprospira sp. CCB-QB6]|uniref:hypothetical protein n=1 Tax=Saprospira sp. CCB-QB6 TaxID=3023936 RepID=UPI00234ADBEB|nr:hypothetical protein [Saprospira sp. CCB-QB6]WCL80314.1 hypothetical protein PPO43_10020 [Saprospira sp. CCB-QB6]
MKQLIFCLLALAVWQTPIWGQTKAIAYKSFAGELPFFNPDELPEDDFGLPPPMMIRLEKLNDSMVVETIRDWDQSLKTDTVKNHLYIHRQKLSMEELRKRYPKYVEFIGFEKDSLPTISPPPAEPHRPGLEEIQKPIDRCPVPPKKTDSPKAQPQPQEGQGAIELLQQQKTIRCKMPEKEEPHLAYMGIAGFFLLFVLGLWYRIS